MLSYHVKFVQTDRRIAVKQYASDVLMRGLKNLKMETESGGPSF